MADYQQFLISNLQTGKFISKDPWLAPDDAWPILLDAYIDKGVLKRRLGTTILGTTTDGRRILGFASIRGYSTTYNIFVDTKNVYTFDISETHTGTITKITSNLFSVGNYDFFVFQEYQGNLYFTANSLASTGYISGVLKYIPGAVSATALTIGSNILGCKMLMQFKNRLLFIYPYVTDTWYPQYVYYSDVNLATVSSGTQFVKAPTDEEPVACGYIENQPVVFFTNSIWQIVYTYDADAPFTWEKRTDAYGAIARAGVVSFQNKLSFIGSNRRLMLYDRYDAVPYDENLRGFLNDWSNLTLTDDSSSPMNFFDYAYAHKLKTKNNIYIAYAILAGVRTKILDYNYEERNFATQRIVPPGTLTEISSIGSFAEREANDYRTTLAGTSIGQIMELDYSNDDNYNVVTKTGSNAISADCRSALLNPYTKQGRKAKLGEVKFLVATNSVINLDISFYKDYDLATPYKTIRVNCAGDDSSSSDKHWITVNANGEVADFHRIQIQQVYPDNNYNRSPFEVHAILLNFKPADRLGNRFSVGTAGGV